MRSPVCLSIIARIVPIVHAEHVGCVLESGGILYFVASQSRTLTFPHCLMIIWIAVYVTIWCSSNCSPGVCSYSIFSDFFVAMSHMGRVGCIIVDSGAPPRISVVDYCDVAWDRLDVWHFRFVRVQGGLLQLCGRHSVNHYSAVCIWIKGLEHPRTAWHGQMCYIIIRCWYGLECSFEEAVYERRLSKLIAPLIVKRLIWWCRRLMHRRIWTSSW